MLKLIVWDLDDTLWRGTLAEGEDVTPITSRVNAIRVLERQGVAHAVCSKNDRSAAMEKLKDFGIEALFVFSEIAFVPKGQLVHRIVTDMGLRFPDVAFIDDNILNLKEVEDACPGILTYDANDPASDVFLERSIRDTAHGSSRTERYRILEAKREDRDHSVGSNEEFLKSCDIRIAVLERTDNLDYAGRIEELINRTNQLNFLKTRVEAGTMADTIIESTRHFTFSAFVWDKYGNYGLVGFASVAFRRRLDHFTFSCRTMNMGIESALASVIQRSTLLEDSDFPVAPGIPSWITIVDPDSIEARAQIEKAVPREPGDPTLRVMANCQSAAIAHYMQDGPEVDYDNWPRSFVLHRFAEANVFPGAWRPVMVYGAFVDYNARYWPESKDPSCEEYGSAVRTFVAAARSKGSRIIALLPPEYFSTENPADGTIPESYREKNEVWRAIARRSEDVDVVEIGELPEAQNVDDPRHFSRDLLVALAQELEDFR